MITLGQLVDLMDPERKNKDTGICFVDGNEEWTVGKIATCCTDVLKTIEGKEVVRIKARRDDIIVWLKTEDTEAPEVNA